MKRILSLLMLFMLILSLCSCSQTKQSDEAMLDEAQSDEAMLVGTWVLNDGKTDLESITFYSDGSCLVDNDENGTWSVVDNTLKVLGPYGGQFWDHDNIVGAYSLSDGELIFTNPVVDGRQRDGQIVYYKD